MTFNFHNNLCFINLKRKTLAWTRTRTWISSFTRWRSNQLSYPGKPLGQARILLLLIPTTHRISIRAIYQLWRTPMLKLLQLWAFMLVTYIGKFSRDLIKINNLKLYLRVFLPKDNITRQWKIVE